MELRNKFQTEAEESGEERNMKYLTFRTDQRLFGISIAEVVQIIGIPPKITCLPDQPAYIKGLISLRGQVIPVIDVRSRFGCPEEAYNERTCIIITHVLGTDFGLIVDEVDEVIDILPEQISPPPQFNVVNNSFLTGIGQLGANGTQQERIVLILHAAKIYNEEEFSCLAEVNHN